MSSTTGFQNLLVNVFRPVYRYETPPGDSNTIFIPKVEMSNVDTYSGNSISVFTAAVGDASSNVYVGSNAGNPYTTVKNCAYVSAFGYSAAAGASNVSNTVFLGYNAGTGATDISSSVVIGANAADGGSSNVRIGFLNTGTGSSNVSIGASTTSSTFSNCILLGRGVTATQNNQFRVGSSYIWGDQSNKWLGLGTSASIYADSNSKFDISGNTTIKGQVGVNMIPDRTLDVNGDFRASDANGTFDFHSGDLSITGGFKRTLASTLIAQPTIQYGKATTGSGGSGSVTVTLPTAYTSSSSYVVQVTMADTDPAEMSANITSSNAFDIYWANGAGGTHTVFWTTFGL